MKRHPTKRSKESKQTMAAFRAEHIGKRCWLCEREQATDPHHIVYRRGDEHDDERNLLAVCPTCHRRIHDGDQTLVTGRKLPAWTLADVLRAKRRHDSDNYDPEFLDRLAHPERILREFFNVKETT
jgi:hypothetical protein